MMENIRYYITDVFGRTIDPRHDFASREEARDYAKTIDCRCGVWVCPSRYEEGEGWIGIGQDEEITPIRREVLASNGEG